jgi:hypothetical protein
MSGDLYNLAHRNHKASKKKRQGISMKRKNCGVTKNKKENS